MNRKLKINSDALVAKAREQIEEIEALEAVKLFGDDNIIFVDLRDVRERERLGYIPGSFHCPRGMAEFWVDPESPYFKDIFAQDKKFIFHCALGSRSSLTVKALNEMGFDASHIKEGFSGWVEAGGKIQKD